VRILLTLPFVFILCGCGNNRAAPVTPIPSAPTPVPAPPSTLTSSEYWILTTTLTDVTGRSVCPAWPIQIGRQVEWLMDVRRGANEVTLLYDVRNFPTDHLALVGTLNGENFEAATAYSSYMPCGGTRLDYDFESRVVGKFSPDGTGMTARETWSYRVPSGDAFVYYFDWVGRAPDSRR
jgi:hypothetical protein